MKSPIQGIEAGVIAYLLFTSTWFECGQFTHVFWWLLCLNESSNKLRLIAEENTELVNSR
jgi:hypothetical protein